MADSTSHRAEWAKAEVARLTSYIIHKHYCENDIEAITRYLAEPFSWFGAAEDEYATGCNTVTAIFQKFAGKVPKCNVYDEHYDVIELAEDTYLSTGRAWVATDPSTGIFLRVHQRIAMAFKQVGDEFTCHHIHLSNPYAEMVSGDVGFPTTLAQQSYEYMKETLDEQRRRLNDQTAVLNSIYETAPCAIMRLARDGEGFYRLLFYNGATADLMGVQDGQIGQMDWSRGICPLMTSEDATRLAVRIDELVKPGDQASSICLIKRVVGEPIYVNSINTFIGQTDEGDIIQKIVFDVTEHVQTEQALVRMSYEDGLTRLYNRTKFRQAFEDNAYSAAEHLGIAYFDINGLKAMNDRCGHAAGDDLICRTANHIRQAFSGDTYRIGGDEFVVIDDLSSEGEFDRQIERALEAMADDSISIAVGASWRPVPCDIRAQFNEADRLMYEHKANYYRSKANDRRRR